MATQGSGLRSWRNLGRGHGVGRRGGRHGHAGRSLVGRGRGGVAMTPEMMPPALGFYEDMPPAICQGGQVAKTITYATNSLSSTPNRVPSEFVPTPRWNESSMEAHDAVSECEIKQVKDLISLEGKFFRDNDSMHITSSFLLK